MSFLYGTHLIEIKLKPQSFIDRLHELLDVTDYNIQDYHQSNCDYKFKINICFRCVLIIWM